MRQVYQNIEVIYECRLRFYFTDIDKRRGIFRRFF